MQNKFYIIIAVAGFLLLSCGKNQRRETAVKIVKEWTGKEIKFPQGLSCTSMGKDTTCIDLSNDNFKILLYIDSLGCTSCRLNLAAWQKIMIESDSIFIRKPEFVFIFQPKKTDEKDFYFMFRSNGFSHPVFIDWKNEINKINKFPVNPEYQCFLLDKDNRVVMVGNPALVPGIWVLFKKVINERGNRVLTMEKNGNAKFVKENAIVPPHFSKYRRI